MQHKIFPETTDNRQMVDIVFENRNRDYGAYVLRKGYSKNVLLGLAFTFLVVLVVILQPILSRMFNGGNEIAEAPPRKLVYSELSIPPSIDKPKPPPINAALPKLQKAIKFVAPKVVKEEIIEETPTIAEIKQNEIAAETLDGTDVVFDEPVAEVVEDTHEIFTVVEQQPEFSGGYDALANFLRSNMKYPPNARRMQIEGTVHVSFIVSKTGSISDVKILRGIMKECDEEAIRVVQRMPSWKPGMQNGHPVYVRMVMPLKFRLN
jgi:periplasmic protein TonB